MSRLRTLFQYLLHVCTPLAQMLQLQEGAKAYIYYIIILCSMMNTMVKTKTTVNGFPVSLIQGKNSISFDNTKFLSNNKIYLQISYAHYSKHLLERNCPK